jgi:hypothetical protein
VDEMHVHIEEVRLPGHAPHQVGVPNLLEKRLAAHLVRILTLVGRPVYGK